MVSTPSSKAVVRLILVVSGVVLHDEDGVEPDAEESEVEWEGAGLFRGIETGDGGIILLLLLLLFEILLEYG